MGMAGTLVLLILTAACANLGGLLLARGVARDREIAIRSAVGAGAARLVRQLFTESLVLSSLGTAAGLFVGTPRARGPDEDDRRPVVARSTPRLEGRGVRGVPGPAHRDAVRPRAGAAGRTPAPSHRPCCGSP